MGFIGRNKQKCDLEKTIAKSWLINTIQAPQFEMLT